MTFEEDEPSLFDSLGEGRARRDEGMGRAEANAAEEWRIAARAAILREAKFRPEFTTDEVWRSLERDAIRETHDRRALGPIMNALVRKGLIHKTGRYTQTTRPEAHAAPKPIYKAGPG